VGCKRRTTTLGKPSSSPDRDPRLRIWPVKGHRRLRPRTFERRAATPDRQGKTVVAISCSIHHRVVASPMSCSSLMSSPPRGRRDARDVKNAPDPILLPSAESTSSRTGPQTLGTAYEARTRRSFFIITPDMTIPRLLDNLRETKLVRALLEDGSAIVTTSPAGESGRAFIRHFRAAIRTSPRSFRAGDLRAERSPTTCARPAQRRHHQFNYDTWWHGGSHGTLFHNSIGIFPSGERKLMSPTTVNARTARESTTRGSLGLDCHPKLSTALARRPLAPARHFNME